MRSFQNIETLRNVEQRAIGKKGDDGKDNNSTNTAYYVKYVVFSIGARKG